MQERLWTRNKTSANIRMTIRGYRYGMWLTKDALRVLGGPEYITLKVNKKMDSLMVVGITEKMKQSFKVPDNYYCDWKKQMQITSRSFVSGLLSSNGMDPNKTYRIEGVYSEKNNAVLFDLNEAEEYSILGQRNGMKL